MDYYTPIIGVVGLIVICGVISLIGYNLRNPRRRNYQDFSSRRGYTDRRRTYSKFNSRRNYNSTNQRYNNSFSNIQKTGRQQSKYSKDKQFYAEEFWGQDKKVRRRHRRWRL